MTCFVQLTYQSGLYAGITYCILTFQTFLFCQCTLTEWKGLKYEIASLVHAPYMHNNFEQTAKYHKHWLWFTCTKSIKRMISFSDYSTHISVGVWEPACSVASHSNFPRWSNTCRFCTGFYPSSCKGRGDSDEPMAADGPSQQVTQICLTSGGGVWWVHYCYIPSARHVSIYL